MEHRTICELVREAEDNDKNGTTTSSKYVTTSMREEINTTEAYLNSKHISGEYDYLGREKPFANIVIAARNVRFKATDIDRKNIQLRATKKKNEINAFIKSLMFQNWMRKVNFGKFLNDWGLCLANHGSAVVKFVEKDGELNCQVEDWNTIIVDPIDFENNIKIKKLWLTPAQLKKQKSYDQELVEKLLNNTQTRKTAEGQQKDNKSNYIEIYEVHGELPLSYLTNKEKDEDTYVQQMHVVTFQQRKDNSDQFDEYTLFSGREAKESNMITHLIPRDGQTYPGGVVKELFQAQWMVNNNEKLIKDKLDGQKNIYQTSDGNLVGQNVLTGMEEGQIVKHAPNEPLTRLDSRVDIAALQSNKQDWQSLANIIAGSSEALQGINPPSGTAWRLQQAVIQQGQSLFEIMTENKGLYVEQMLREYVLPYFNKKLNNSDEVALILEDHEIKKFDALYLPNEAMRRVNQKKKQTILNGEIYDPGMEATDLQTATQELQSNLVGNQRFIKPSEIDKKTWKEILGNDDELEIDVTGEAKDVQAALTTLGTTLQTIAANPGILQDPNAKLIFDKILSMSGTISPLEIKATAVQPMPGIIQSGQLLMQQTQPV